MVPNIQRLEAAITGTDSTGTKKIFYMDKNVRLLDAQYWITGTEATALEIAIAKNDFEDAGTPVELGVIEIGTGDQAGLIAGVDLEGAEVLAGQAVIVSVKVDSTDTKNGSIILRFVEGESNLVDLVTAE